MRNNTFVAVSAVISLKRLTAAAILKYRDKHKEREIERETNRGRDRQNENQAEGETGRMRIKQNERERE